MGMDAKVFKVIREWADTPFSYGKDCCQFAGAVVEITAGYNPMTAFDYADEAEADAAIATYGTLQDAVTAHLGEPAPPPYKTGDVTLHVQKPSGEQIVGVVIDDRSVVRTKQGITDWPLERAVCVWSV
jgi:hypothetical protein